MSLLEAGRSMMYKCDRSDNLEGATGHLTDNVGKDLGYVVILGSGDGQWPRVIVEGFKTKQIDSYLWWKNHERPALAFHHERVTVKTDEIGSVAPHRCDTLICDIEPTSLKQELRNLKFLRSWVAFRPNICVLRVVHYPHEWICNQLDDFSAHLGDGRLLIVRDPPLTYHAEVTTRQTERRRPKKKKSFLRRLAVVIGKILCPCSVSSSPKQPSLVEDLARHQSNALIPKQREVRARWPIPDNIPVEQLAPLDMGATLAQYGKLNSPERLSKRRFLKELGWIPFSCRPNNKFHRHPILEQLVEQLLPLIENKDRWVITSNDPEVLNNTIKEKIDHAPKENHEHHKYLWLVYQAIAEHLREKGGKIQRLTDDELVAKANKDSSMGNQDRELGFENMKEYLESDKLSPELSEFKKHLLAGRPIKSDYNSCAKREPKIEDRPRMVWSLSATGRLYEAQVLGSVDDLLKLIPFAKHGPQQDFGEKFNRMMNQKSARYAICDDIKGWDTKVSYSLHCMEAAFLQLLTDDKSLKEEIKHLYRLYAYAVVGIIEAHTNQQGQKSYRKVFYQLQGQVASGRRVTYSMNTITNIAVTLARAAYSQRVELGDVKGWAKRCLLDSHHYKYGGMVAGDDTVIVMAEQEAKLFAYRGANFMNDLGMVRKGTGTNHSELCESLSKIEFCSRKFVKLSCRSTFRWVPIRKVGVMIMKKLLREGPPSGDHEYQLAWLREQARIWLVESYYLPTIKTLAFAILSATPSNIALSDDEKSYEYTPEPKITKTTMIEAIHKYHFSRDSKFKNLEFNPWKSTYISSSDLSIYDLNCEHSLYKQWQSSLPSIIRKIRLPGKDYEDWLEEPTHKISVARGNGVSVQQRRPPRRTRTARANAKSEDAGKGWLGTILGGLIRALG